MHKKRRNKTIELFRRFPVTLLFLICIVVANVWKLVQTADRIHDASVAPVELEMEHTTNSETVVVTGTYITNQSETGTQTEMTELPTPTFQTVDDTYFSDALFIGDSRSEGLALYGDFTEADYFTNVGMSIFDVNEVQAGNPNKGERVTLAEKLSQRRYGKVYLMLGLNELGTGTAESWTAAYADVVEQVRTAQPDAIIYLQSILPVSAAKDDPNSAINNTGVRTRNAALEAIADPAHRIYYLNVAEAVLDANGCLDASYTSDGIHLLGNSLYLWEDYLKQHAIVLDASETTTVPALQETQETT